MGRLSYHEATGRGNSGIIGHGWTNGTRTRVAGARVGRGKTLARQEAVRSLRAVAIALGAGMLLFFSLAIAADAAGRLPFAPEALPIVNALRGALGGLVVLVLILFAAFPRRWPHPDRTTDAWRSRTILRMALAEALYLFTTSLVLLVGMDPLLTFGWLIGLAMFGLAFPTEDGAREFARRAEAEAELALEDATRRGEVE